MRFLVLLKKELRECLPWVLLAAAFVFTFGFFVMITHGRRIEYDYEIFTPGSSVSFSYFKFISRASCEPVGVLLFFASTGLGLALGIRQFWMAHFTRTWGFTLHRSADRAIILLAKLAAAAVSITFSLGLVWLYFYWYVSRSGFSSLPLGIRVFFEGWVFIMFGLVVYLGTALSGLSRARWYTTKMLGLAFSILIYATIVAQWRLTWAFSTVITGIVILLSQIIDTFLSREF